MAAEPRFGRKLGTFEFDYMNRTSRQKVGALMTQYHGSMGDPYYAVGSFYLSDHAYPKLEIVERALSQVEEDIRKADAGASGWGKQEAMELRAIGKYLAWDIARMKSAGRSSGAEDTNWEKFFDRRKYNRMNGDEQDAYIKQLKERARRERERAQKQGHASGRSDGPWRPAAGGTEPVFTARSGKRMQYVFQASTGRHAYLDVDTDTIMSDEDARAHLDARAGRSSGQSDTDARNRATSEKEIADWLANPPERAFVYYTKDMREVQNWMGVKMGDIVRTGPVTRRFGGKVQSVGVRGTNGVGYHGICNLTGGTYCKLRRVNNQNGRSSGEAPVVYELDPGYAYKQVRRGWDTEVVSDDDSRRSVAAGFAYVDGQRMRVFKVGRTVYAQTFGRVRQR